MWFTGKLNRGKRGAGSIIGATFLVLILLTGYTFYFLNVNVTEDYNKTLQDREELDLKRNKENIEFTSVSFDGNELNITVKNTGSYQIHLIWLGIFDETAANTQDYYKINFYVNPAETIPNIGNTSIPDFEGLERVIQLVTELGNTFSYSYPASENGDGSQTEITVTAGTASSNTKAFIAYLSSTLSGNQFPKNRTWDGSSWSTESEMPTAGSPIRFVRVAYCSLSGRHYERIVVTLSSDRYLDAYVWTGSSWDHQAIPTRVAYGGDRCFDIQYEKTSGNAMLCYSIDNMDEIGYRIWNGTSWETEEAHDLGSGVEIRWIALAQNPTSSSNELALICSDNNRDAYGLIWDGDSWGNQQLLDNDVSYNNRECIAVSYETNSGDAMFIWGTRNSPYYMESRKWNGAWGGELPTVDLSTRTRWFTLKADPASNRLMALYLGNDNHLSTISWDGSNWATAYQHDTSVRRDNRRCADFEWEPNGSKGLIFWGRSDDTLKAWKFTAPSTWTELDMSAFSSINVGWAQLRRNTRNVTGDTKIMGAVLLNNNNLGALRWDGSTLTYASSNFTTNTGSPDYECFDIEFSNFGEAPAGDNLAYDTWRTYTIQVTTDSESIPYVSIGIYADGSTATFRNEDNPDWVHADENGQYSVQIKSTTPGGETFYLYVVVGTLLEKKQITQEP